MTKRLTVLGLPLFLLLAVFIYRHPQVTFSLSSAKGSQLDLPSCGPNALGQIDQNIYVTRGSTSSYDWSESVGCVSRPLLTAWAVTHNPQEMGVSDKAQSVVRAIVPPPAGSTHLYRVTYTVQNVLTVTWTLDWLHHLVAGTINDPTDVLINITKYSGSSLISHFNGAIRLLKISPNVTLATSRIELKAPQSNQNTAAQGAQEVIVRLRTGTPFWNGLTSSHLVDFE